MQKQIEKNKTRNALGTGLSSLLDLNDLPTEADTKDCWYVAIDRVIPDAKQPRHKFSEGALSELADSIRQHGILSPIIVRPSNNDCYILIAGERRLRAAKMAGLMVIPAIVRDISDVEAMEFALIENIQREDLTVLEEANGYLRLLQEYNYTQEQLAKVIGKSRSHIANMLRLLELPDSIKDMLDDGALSMGHARAIIKAEYPTKVADIVIEQGLSVRQTERLVNKKPSNNRTKSHAISKSEEIADLKRMEEAIGEKLGLSVKIDTKCITIEYNDLYDLDFILNKLSA